MSVLMIGAPERDKIAAIIAYAKAHPVPLDKVRDSAVFDKPVLTLADRKPGTERPASQHVVFPGGFRAAFSIEQQPAGLCSHLSISVDREGQIPSKAAVEMIAKEFAVPTQGNVVTWLEEFEPGQFAINLVALYAPVHNGKNLFPQ